MQTILYRMILAFSCSGFFCIAQANGELQEAVQEKQSKDTQTTKENSRVKKLFDKGVSFWNKQDLDSAIKEFSEVIKLDPKNHKAYIYRGGAYAEKKERDRAFADFNQAIR